MAGGGARPVLQGTRGERGSYSSVDLIFITSLLGVSYSLGFGEAEINETQSGPKKFPV